MSAPIQFFKQINESIVADHYYAQFDADNTNNVTLVPTYMPSGAEVYVSAAFIHFTTSGLPALQCNTRTDIGVGTTSSFAAGLESRWFWQARSFQTVANTEIYVGICDSSGGSLAWRLAASGPRNYSSYVNGVLYNDNNYHFYTSGTYLGFLLDAKSGGSLGFMVQGLGLFDSLSLSLIGSPPYYPFIYGKTYTENTTVDLVLGTPGSYYPFNTYPNPSEVGPQPYSPGLFR